MDNPYDEQVFDLIECARLSGACAYCKSNAEFCNGELFELMRQTAKNLDILNKAMFLACVKLNPSHPNDEYNYMINSAKNELKDKKY